MRWFRIAADCNFATAQRAIGGLYLKDGGVPRDLTQARSWFEKAAAGGNDEAKHIIDFMQRADNGDESAKRMLELLEGQP